MCNHGTGGNIGGNIVGTILASTGLIYLPVSFHSTCRLLVIITHSTSVLPGKVATMSIAPSTSKDSRFVCMDPTPSQIFLRHSSIPGRHSEHNPEIHPFVYTQHLAESRQLDSAFLSRTVHHWLAQSVGLTSPNFRISQYLDSRHREFPLAGVAVAGTTRETTSKDIWIAFVRPTPRVTMKTMRKTAVRLPPINIHLSRAVLATAVSQVHALARQTT